MLLELEVGRYGPVNCILP